MQLSSSMLLACICLLMPSATFAFQYPTNLIKAQPKTFLKMSGITDNDKEHMKRCLELAAAAKEAGDIPVGCVLVTEDGKIVAEAAETLPSTTSSDPVGHAEILAVRKACGALNTMSLRGMTLYTTAEPCWMCSFVIRETGVSKVVYGTPTVNMGGQTSKYPILTDPDQVPTWSPPPEVVSGLMEEECKRIRA